MIRDAGGKAVFAHPLQYRLPEADLLELTSTLVDAGAVETAEYVEKNTPEHATFMTWTQHINPVSALAGRDIVCGPGLWLYWHGYDLSERENDIRAFYADPEANGDILAKYHVDYILVGDYERGSLQIDQEALERLYTLVFHSEWGDMRVYRVEDSHG